jgi:ubiquinone/menaquinone biosynthesis C-methylase UbiE
MPEPISSSATPFDQIYFSTRYSRDPGRDTAWKAIAAYLQRFVEPNSAVLDLGAGYCHFINNIQAAEKHAVDIFPSFPKFAATDVKAHVTDCRNLSAFSDRSIGTVFASNLLEHLSREDSFAVLKEVRRVLKPGGRIILLQPNFRFAYREYFDDYTHIQIFTDKGLADCLAAHGFQVETVYPSFLPFSFKSRLPTWRWLVSLYLHLPWRPFAKQMLVIGQITN